MSRRSKFNFRVAQQELDELRAEAARHNISVAALLRINSIQAREQREREQIKRRAYPDREA